MPYFLKACVISKTLSPWHTIAITTLREGYEHYRVADLVIDWGFSVEKTRQIVKDINNGRSFFSWKAEVPVHLLYEHLDSSRYNRDTGDHVDVMISGLIINGSQNITRARKNGLKKISAQVLYPADLLRVDILPAPVYPYSQNIKSTEGLAPKPTLEQGKKIKRLNQMLVTHARARAVNVVVL